MIQLPFTKPGATTNQQPNDANGYKTGGTYNKQVFRKVYVNKNIHLEDTIYNLDYIYTKALIQQGLKSAESTSIVDIKWKFSTGHYSREFRRNLK